jgi:hypothetical protein
MKGISRLLAALMLPEQVPLLIERVDFVISKMTGNAYFPNPIPTLAALTAANNTLRVAQVAAGGRGVGLVQARNSAQLVVMQLAQELLGVVQGVADANAASAAAVIESAGMFVRKVTPPARPAFAVTEGAVTGSARARVKSQGRNATYWWAYSTDQRTWVSAPVTRVASTTFSGLTAGTTYYFRYQAMTAAGLGDWSQVVSFMPR